MQKPNQLYRVNYKQSLPILLNFKLLTAKAAWWDTWNLSSCLHVHMHIKNIMFNILTIFFNWSKFLLKKFMTWYFLDKKIKNAEYGKIPFVSARNFCWNWNYAKNCHFLKLWLTEHLKGSEEYYFRLPRKEIHKRKKKLSKLR